MYTSSLRPGAQLAEMPDSAWCLLRRGVRSPQSRCAISSFRPGAQLVEMPDARLPAALAASASPTVAGAGGGGGVLCFSITTRGGGPGGGGEAGGGETVVLVANAAHEVVDMTWRMRIDRYAK